MPAESATQQPTPHECDSAFLLECVHLVDFNYAASKEDILNYMRHIQDNLPGMVSEYFNANPALREGLTEENKAEISKLLYQKVTSEVIRLSTELTRLNEKIRATHQLFITQPTAMLTKEQRQAIDQTIAVFARCHFQLHQRLLLPGEDLMQHLLKMDPAANARKLVKAYNKKIKDLKQQNEHMHQAVQQLKEKLESAQLRVSTQEKLIEQMRKDMHTLLGQRDKARLARQELSQQLNLLTSGVGIKTKALTREGMQASLATEQTDLNALVETCKAQLSQTPQLKKYIKKAQSALARLASWTNELEIGDIDEHQQLIFKMWLKEVRTQQDILQQHMQVATEVQGLQQDKQELQQAVSELSRSKKQTFCAQLRYAVRDRKRRVSRRQECSEYKAALVEARRSTNQVLQMQANTFNANQYLHAELELAQRSIAALSQQVGFMFANRGGSARLRQPQGQAQDGGYVEVQPHSY